MHLIFGLAGHIVEVDPLTLDPSRLGLPGQRCDLTRVGEPHLGRQLRLRPRLLTRCQPRRVHTLIARGRLRLRLDLRDVGVAVDLLIGERGRVRLIPAIGRQRLRKHPVLARRHLHLTFLAVLRIADLDHAVLIGYLLGEPHMPVVGVMSHIVLLVADIRLTELQLFAGGLFVLIGEVVAHRPIVVIGVDMRKCLRVVHADDGRLAVLLVPRSAQRPRNLLVPLRGQTEPAVTGAVSERDARCHLRDVVDLAPPLSGR